MTKTTIKKTAKKQRTINLIIRCFAIVYPLNMI